MRDKLKICLVGVSPAIIRNTRLKGIPMAPLSLKSYAEYKLAGEFPDAFEIKILTFYTEEIGPVEMASQIILNEPDIVVFSVYIWNYHEIMECAKIISKTRDDIRIVCGGPQVSPIAEEVMAKHPYIDIVPYITTPGEVIFYKLLKACLERKDLSSVPGIVVRSKDARLCKTAPLTEEMDYESAQPLYADRSLKLPKEAAHAVVLEGSRGCPFDCGYCFYSRGLKKIDYFPLKKILEEIDSVYSLPGVRHVFFADSDILLDPKRAKIIVEKVLEHNHRNIVSEFEINITRITEQVVRLLSRLPGYRFCFAIQTSNKKALSNISRLRPEADEFTEKMRAFKKWSPETEFHIDVMLGLPGDDLEGFKGTLDLCLSVRPTRIGINYPIYLLPGTRFYENRKELGITHNVNPPYCIIETESFPKADIEKALRLSLWIEILTYYHPAIADFFYKRCSEGNTVSMIETLECWVSAIETRLDIFSGLPNIVDTATGGSVKEWGKLKGAILKRASSAKEGFLIYQAISERENIGKDNPENEITCGLKIFDHLRSKNIDTVEFSSFGLLPAGLTAGLDEKEVRSFFSKYKR